MSAPTVIPDLIQLIIAVVMIVFIMWLFPQGIGFQPFFYDLFNQDKLEKEAQRKKQEALSYL